MLTINYKDSRPIYQQITDGLRRLILTGAIKPDEKLPSVRDLAASLAINPNTIQRAYRELEHQGLIYTAAGKGAFASSDSSAAEMRREELKETMLAAVLELRSLGVSDTELEQILEDFLKEGKDT